MRRKTILIILLIAGVISILKAQNESAELITDRPDQTESSSVVPLHVLQIETGYIQENSKTELTQYKYYVYNTTLLRYGILENLELRCGLEYLGDKTEYKNTKITHSTSGFSPLYVGFKISITNEETWKPEIAFLGGMTFSFTAGEDYKTSYSTADIRFAFSHALSEHFSLGYNLGAEWNGETAIPSYFYSFVLGYGINDKFGAFLEAYGLIPEEGYSEHLLDTGLTYLLHPNLQIDISGGIGLNNNALDNFISIGLTYRFQH